MTMTSQNYIPPGHIGGQINSDHLHERDDFNVDPGAAYLADAGSTAIHDFNATEHADPKAQRSANRRQFVGRAVGGVKRVMKRDPNRPHDDRYDNEADLESRAESSTSETLRGSLLETAELAGTTAVDHEPYIEVEPAPASDYAKMDSPTPPSSDVSYLSRIHRFFRDLGDLPWVSPDRVTADYVPGQSKKRRPRQIERPAVSWYDGDPRHQNLSINLLSSGSPTTIQYYPSPAVAVPVQMRTTNTIWAPGTDHETYPTGYVPYQPPVAAYPNHVVFPPNRPDPAAPVVQVNHVSVPNQYPYPTFA
ncbi:hypothetical protein C8J56DRAFT_925926 [Mycena floridula]|nr:hypothetical protein C8J56DRAFT_925926 [Mycena floridula]